MGCLVVCLAGLSSGSALSGQDDVERYLRSATALYERFEFERALEHVRHAKALQPTPDQTITLSLLEGILLYELGKPEEAGGAFLEGLTLDHSVKLPWKVSPKIATAFEQARAELPKAHEVKREVSGRGSGSAATAVAITSFSVGLAAAAGGTACAVVSRQHFDALNSATVAPGNALSVRDSGERLQIAAGVLLGIAAAAVATGAIVWVAKPGEATPKLSAVAGPGTAALVLSGVWP